jgi:hypothetical protein
LQSLENSLALGSCSSNPQALGGFHEAPHSQRWELTGPPPKAGPEGTKGPNGQCCWDKQDIAWTNRNSEDMLKRVPTLIIEDY